MRFSIRLYSTAPEAATPGNIAAAISIIDFSKSVEVSRTVGPANWFTINKHALEGQTVSFPPEDLSRVPHTEPLKISKLAREGSALSVCYSFTKSNRLAALTQSISQEVPKEAQGFFLSGARFTFGPLDIVEFTEDDEGQDDVKLVAVSQFAFALVCDDYRGDVSLLRSSLDSVPKFTQLRADLERIAGPLILRLSC